MQQINMVTQKISLMNSEAHGINEISIANGGLKWQLKK